MTATKKYRVPGWLRLGVPGSAQGQMIERAYGLDLQSCVAVCRERDRSSGEVRWLVADLTDEEVVALEYYAAGGESYPPNVESPYEVVEIAFEIE